MSPKTQKPKWSLPYSTLDPADPAGRGRIKAARIAAYILLAVAIITPIVQFQVMTRRNHRRGVVYRQALRDFRSKYGHLTTQQLARQGLTPPTPPKKVHKGAVARWRVAVRAFWEGRNIYLKKGASRAPNTPVAAAGQPKDRLKNVWLHPNTPFTVILLTPFAMMPVLAMAVALNLCKALVLIASILMAAGICNHEGKRMPDWVVGLAMLWGILLVVGDIQHGNTNVFVLGAITLHLWLYRRGRDVLSGGALALAVCLKMTPALFVLYWLYQRNWKLLVAATAAMVLLAVVVPAVAVGPDHYATLTATWYENLIKPGLVKGSWYPIHINQSLSGVVSRYFFPQPHPSGNIFWNPDDNPYQSQDQFYWITLAPLSGARVKAVFRIGQVLIVALAAWAIGWRKLPRSDARRGLHYAIVLLGILLLNQRTWDHHAAILVPAYVAIWYAIAFGRTGPRARKWGLYLAVLAGPLVWLGGTELFKGAAWIVGESRETGDRWADIAEAYGPAFYHFLLMFIVAAILCLALKRPADPYADERQKLAS